jgi:hypothetical protein
MIVSKLSSSQIIIKKCEENDITHPDDYIHVNIQPDDNTKVAGLCYHPTR